ncbi:MAG TPA: hypothetical protein ENN40_00700 [Candidatus Aminicenantes bacterium]|mgnify:CR=1 FL=1|nr:hypothetical protein [Candidatus Aminicenantes bacterium]
MKIIWQGLAIFSLLLAVACNSGESPVTETVFPEITSSRRGFALQSPEDDTHFVGNWSGSLFDGHTYRSIPLDGGSVRFTLDAAQTLLLTLRLRAEDATSLSVLLNQHHLKELQLVPKPPSEYRVLLPRRLLRKKENLISFVPDTAARIRFYHLAIAPPGRSEPAGITPPPLAVIQLPSTLEYLMRTGEGHLNIRFSQPIPRIRLTIDNGEDVEFHREWHRKDCINLDLAKWPDGIRRLRFRMDGSTMTFGLLASQRTRFLNSADPYVPETPEPGKDSGMNVLMILLDSARADRFSCAGYHRPTTPHIDALARRAWRFQNAWAEAAYTLASTATLFSGLAPDQHNAVSNYFGGLNPGILTLAEKMEQAGYHTAAVSAIPYCGRAFHMEQGFSTFIELFQETPQPLASEFPPRLDQIIQESAKRKKPFFAYLHMREPHIDYLMPPPYYGSFHRGYQDYPNPRFLKKLKEIYFGRKEHSTRKHSPQDLELLNDAYDENLLFADAMVGKMLQSLKDHGLHERTAVIVLGDHGEGLGEHGEIGHNTVMHPEGLRIPVIFAIPGWSDSGGVISHPVTTSDLTASLSRIFAGAPLPGTGEKGLFRARPVPTLVSRSIFFSEYHNHWSVLEYPYQAILTGYGDSLSCRVINIENDPRGRTPLEHPLHQSYFFQRLVDTLRNRRLEKITPIASSLKKKEIESLKSLGYL